ncbi:MAG: hypothetical protein RBU27_11895 [Bacteroidota bacterium]|jgi:hypothetical protein|nr:hypothetical protein [Bacteroidota bacterium]
MNAYAFLLFRNSDQLIPGIQAVSQLPAVAAWHAVDGHFHLVLTLREANDGLRDELTALPGVADLQYCPVDREMVRDFVPDPARCHAWLTMEVDAAKSDELERMIPAITALSFGALAFGACGCVAALSGETFEEIDAAIDAHLRPLDGVLRVKREWIIDLTQL